MGRPVPGAQSGVHFAVPLVSLPFGTQFPTTPRHPVNGSDAEPLSRVPQISGFADGFQVHRARRVIAYPGGHSVSDSELLLDRLAQRLPDELNRDPVVDLCEETFDDHVHRLIL